MEIKGKRRREILKEFDTPSPTYSTRLLKESEDGNLILFGRVTEEYAYPDGTHPEGHLSISKYLWEQAGKPESIVVSFSAEDYCCISIEAYDKMVDARLSQEGNNGG